MEKQQQKGQKVEELKRTWKGGISEGMEVKTHETEKLEEGRATRWKERNWKKQRR